MAVVRASVIGAVTFFAGLSLAGPQATGVARADVSDPDSGSVATGQTAGMGRAKAPDNRGSVRHGRNSSNSLAPNASTTAARVASADTSPALRETTLPGAHSRAVAENGGSASAWLRRPQPAAVVAPGSYYAAPIANSTVPVMNSETDPVETAAVSLPAAAAITAFGVAPVNSAASAVSAAPHIAPAHSVKTAVQAIRATAARLLDEIHNWLSGFGPNRITDVLAAAVWEVRKALVPVGSAVGAGGTPKCVAAKDCSGQNLKGANLSGLNLSGVNFEQSDLTKANLSKTTLDGANLADSYLWGADLTDVKSAVNADFTAAQLVGQPDGPETALLVAKLNGANLAGANLFALNFLREPLDAVIEMKKVNLSGDNLESANLPFADLTDAKLNGVNFQYANLMSATLERANLNDADLSSAQLTSADLYQAQLIKAILRFAILDDASFNSANLTGANLDSATRYNTSFLNATCPNGKVEGKGGNCSA